MRLVRNGMPLPADAVGHGLAVADPVGVPEDRRKAMLDEIHFPIDLNARQAFLAPLRITHDALINHMGGSP